MLAFRLAVIALKRKKETGFILAGFILMAVMFMIMGISTYNRANTLFYEKTKELQSAHFLVPCVANTYRTEYEEYIQKWQGLELFEKEEAVFMPTSTNNRNKLELGAFIFNKDSERQISPFQIIEEDTSVPEEKAIYVPVQQKSENVLLGQDYVITYKGKDWHFQVAGYFETTAYCNINSGFYKYFVSDENYRKLAAEVGKAYILSARFSGDEKEIAAVTDELKKCFLRDTQYVSDTQTILQEALDYVEMQRRSILNMMFGIVLLFAVSILICMVVVFIIMNYIREDIQKSMIRIGTLQSMGYTLSQIRNSYLGEYGIIGCIGGVMGIIFSYIGMELMKPFLTGMCGFTWQDSFHPAEDMTAFLLILFLVLAAGTLAVRRLKNVTPVDALSQRSNGKGQYAASWPLQKGRLSLNLQMAIKNVQIHKKSNVLFSLIVAIGAFAIGITLILFLNFSANSGVLLSTIGLELADLQVKTMQGCDMESFARKMENYPEVRKVNSSSTGAYLKYKNEAVKTIVEQDFDKIEVVRPYEGDFPHTANEVLISSQISSQEGLKSGDSITLTANGVEKDYLISGVFASTNGYVVYISYDGIRMVYPDFAFNCIDVYLKEGMNTDEFKDFLLTTYKVSVDHEATSTAEDKIARLLADYGVSSVSYSIWKDGVEIYSGNSSAFRISDITDMKSFATGQIESYSRALSTIVLIVFITMITIICGVLYVTIKAEVQKKTKEYGILKALGYTTGDIVRQLSLRYLMTTIAGCLAGAGFAVFCAPGMFRIIFSMMGVTQVDVNGYAEILLLYSCIFSAVLYLVTMLTGYRIKKISAYALMTE